MSEKVLKYKKSFALEPMNAYERRIIHSACQNIEGVTTRSIGEGADRKIVISPEKK
jgi:spoIIIJ-associated protein